MVNYIDNYPSLKIYGGCFGHQILAKAIGGEVGSMDSLLVEISEHTVENIEEWKKLGGTKEKVYFHKTHGDIVTKIPSNAKLMLSTSSN